MIVFAFISCQQEQQNDDQQLLELVLQSKQNQFIKPIYLKPKGDKISIQEFFRLRNKNNKTFRFAHKSDLKKEIINDSLYVKYDTIIYEKKKIKSNQYLIYGKGVDEKFETFLKDSFNYKQSRIVKWVIPKSLDEKLLKNKDDNDYAINVSAPVYNLDKNKAIIKTFYRSSRNTAQHSIYFIEKNDDIWSIIYSEKGDMFLDLKIK
ncbi:hypothetical protein KORDIASMS9_02811 [Kordia sp. SMS9]|nr:hypothetical protein KORDIASMS9_02811 [Kordia sp. SMS9]